MTEGDKTNLNDDEKLIEQYMNQLDGIHKQALSIAKEHLETSFDIIKSNGYKKWLQKIEEK